MTDCKGCKHENECNYTQKYDYKYDAIVDYQNDKEYNSFKDISELLNEKEERIKELENKLNQTALEFLNYKTISMGKAVEISEMSYHDFIKYRAEHGNQMELQL